jgi:hypothetical protein
MPKRPMHEPRLLHGLDFIQLTMSVELTSSNSPSAEAHRPSTMNSNFISVWEVTKLVPYFKGSKREVLVFIGNGDTVFAVINPVQEDVLYKFILTRISGEPRTAVRHTNLIWQN